MRNANKCHMPYSAMVTKTEKWSGIRICMDHIPTKSWSVLRIGRPNDSFNEIGSLLLQ